LGDDQTYITEVNAGRTGTVSLWFSLASRMIYGDHRVNFHHQLLRAHHGTKLLSCKKHDALPEGIKCVRHIDMGSLLLWRDQQVRVPVKAQVEVEAQ